MRVDACHVLHCIVLVALLIVSNPRHNLSAQTAPNVSHGPDYDISVSRVVALSSTSPALYSLSYQYRFPGRSTVYVEGLGLVRASGELTYLTSDSELRFRESAGGRILTTVPLKETIVLQSGSAPEMPSPDEFGDATLEGVLPRDALFFEKSSRILNTTFPSGYSVRRADDVNTYVTTWTKLSGWADLHLLGQIAVAISHPYEARDSSTRFRVKFVARESRSSSPTWRSAGQSVNDAAVAFVNTLIARLENAAGK